MERIALFKTKIFWKFFLPYLVIFSVLLAAAIFIFEHKISPTITRTALRTLNIEVMAAEETLRLMLMRQNLAEMRTFIDRVAAGTETSITVLTPDFKVIFDADNRYESGRSLAHLEELKEAQTSGSSKIIRQGQHDVTQTYYFVRRVENDGKTLGYIMSSMPMLRAEKDIVEARNLLIGVILFGGFIGLFLGYRRSRIFTVPIYEMKQVCEALQKGRYDEKVKSISRDELGKLGETLNRLGSEITKQIETISYERAQLKTIVASMVEGIVSLDENNTLQFCNSAAYSLVNSGIRDGRNKPIESLKGFNLLTDLVDKARSTLTLEEEEITIQEDGVYKVLECYASTFKTGDMKGVIIVLHNVTELRHLERVRRDFVANASHEIKTPLTNIKGYAETLLSGALDDEVFAKKFVEKIDNNATRLQQLVQDLLSLARIEAHEEGIRIIPTNWHQIVHQGLHRYEDSIAKKNLKVILDEKSLTTQIFGDIDCMTQVFDNLLTNAIRYTPDGGEIRVSCTKSEKHGLLHVEDNGIGIKQKHLERIFERFYRVDKARSRELGGTGLGLAIVKHLVTNMNGKIFVTSEVGIGSKFTIGLRLTGT